MFLSVSLCKINWDYNLNKIEFSVSYECLLEISQITAMANKKHHSLSELFMLKHEANKKSSSLKYLALFLSVFSLTEETVFISVLVN